MSLEELAGYDSASEDDDQSSNADAQQDFCTMDQDSLNLSLYRTRENIKMAVKHRASQAVEDRLQDVLFFKGIYYEMVRTSNILFNRVY
jgi:hypothetical protein